ncbi:CBS domain-containing protein [Aldersonia kunmingensis]|uniref:CBS domain-containing protein n=1 Tax=Aldersonia kunmingensis TaxID=408066 RepID=UPI000829F984|nr:CBS domain-containing protein [Aldersonia kunmingensis]
MQARHIMSTPVTTVSVDTPTDECVEIIARKGFTVLPVLDHEEHLVGIVSDGDLLRERLRSSTPLRHPVRETMTSPVIAMTPDADISDLASAMLRTKLRGIPILLGRQVVGIVTRRDLIGALTTDDANIAKEVQHRLDVYGGEGRWSVEVADGQVQLSGVTAEDPERGVVAALAETVPGVRKVAVV